MLSEPPRGSSFQAKLGGKMPTNKFSDDPQTTWLTEVGPDRNMMLLEDFYFWDRQSVPWKAAKGLKTDGTSIPRALWTLIGSPFTGDYRRAALVHDQACDDDGGDAQKRAAADRMFFEACRAGGCSVWDATVLYLGVRVGAAWDLDLLDNEGPRLTHTATDNQIQQDFQDIAAQILKHDLVDDAAVLEKRTDEAMRTVNEQRAAARHVRPS